MDAREETALQALARVARHHGLHVDIDRILHETPGIGTDANTGALLKAARAAGLKARALRLVWEDLGKLARTFPAVVRLTNGNSMLLESIASTPAGDMVVLRDPTLGDGEEALLLLDHERFASAWDGEILLFKRDYALNDDNVPFGMPWVARLVWREKRLFRDVGVAALLMSVLALVPPIFFFLVVDRVLTYRSVTTLNILVCGLLFGIFFDTLFGYLRRWLINFATVRVDTRINLYVMNKLLRLPIDMYERTPIGRIVGDVSEVWRIRSFLAGQLFGTILDGVSLLILIPAMFVLSASLSWLVLCLAAMICGVIVLFLPMLSRQHARVVDAEREQHSFLIETLHGMRTVKSLALDPLKRREWDVRVARSVRERKKYDEIYNIPQTLVAPIEKLMHAGTVAVGAYMVVVGGSTLNAGLLVAFSMIAGRVVQPLVQLAQLLNQFQEARSAVHSVARVMNVPEEGGRSGRGARPKIDGLIEFERLRFRYPGTTTNALDDVSFQLPAGSLIGVMGRSGSGKTTITRLLQGLNQTYEGLVLIDGIELREFDIDHLRQNIGVVLQENFLFHGTIRDNIAAARPSSSFEEVVRAARLAGAEEFIQRMPQGFETILESGAPNLSGGQRQRVAIARALITDPRILILDEATSALDAESEAIVNANLLRIARGRTVVMISHRLSCLVPADRILVLERGRLYDQGTHDELLQRCDIYRHLWLQQNRHMDPRPVHEITRATSP
jgi:ATP-binding cassette, subfamily B, bacterial HlyB/CyaB